MEEEGVEKRCYGENIERTEELIQCGGKKIDVLKTIRNFLTIQPENFHE